jgi:uncharacterized protein
MTTSLVRDTALCVLLLATLGAQTLRAQDVPAHVGKVNDFAEVLDPAQRQALEVQLADLERATSAEVALVTMPTLGERPIENYATLLFNTWEIGKKDRDNGVLVLVAVRDRTMRIEVGYGLEGVLPDGLAGAIMRESFLPRFRSGEYVTGVREGMARVIDIVRRNEVVTAEQRAALAEAAAEAGKSWDLAWVAVPFVAAAAFSLGTAAGAKVAVQLLFGLAFTGGILYFTTYVIPRPATWFLALVAVAITALGFVLGRRPKWRRRIRGSGAGGGGGNWISEGTSSSSSGSGGGSDSSSSGGDFGGGSSGGGGATGHW